MSWKGLGMSWKGRYEVKRPGYKLGMSSRKASGNDVIDSHLKPAQY